MKHIASLALLVVLCAFASQVQAGDAFKIDPVHSSVIFRIGHANVGIIYGRFNDAAGEFTIDKDDATKNTFNIELQVNNVDTHQEKRDAHLKSPDFFNARQYPKITFKSTNVAKGEGKMLEVTGDLTIHGVTKSIKVPVEIVGQGDFGGTFRVGIEAIFNIKRSDFEMKGLPGAVGDDVRLMIAIEGGK